MKIDPPNQSSHRGLAYIYTSYIYIERKEMNPSGLFSTESLHTATLLIYIEKR